MVAYGDQCYQVRCWHDRCPLPCRYSGVPDDNCTSQLRRTVHNRGVERTQRHDIACHNCKNTLRECLIEYEQSSAVGVRPEYRTPRVVRPKLAKLHKD